MDGIQEKRPEVPSRATWSDEVAWKKNDELTDQCVCCELIRLSSTGAFLLVYEPIKGSNVEDNTFKKKQSN